MIKPKFEVGEHVYSVRVGWTEKHVTCPDCLGKKEWTVSLPSGEVFQHDCQTCRRGYFSTGQVSEWGDHAHIDLVTIGSVRLDTADENPVSYMCVETGVGSGSIYYEKNMAKTRLEAEEIAAQELARVAGLRQAEELKSRKHRKGDSLIHGKRKKKVV